MRSAKIVIASKVSEWLECLFINFSELLVHQSVKTIDKADELNIASLLLESQEAIDHIVAAGGLLA